MRRFMKFGMFAICIALLSGIVVSLCRGWSKLEDEEDVLPPLYVAIDTDEIVTIPDMEVNGSRFSFSQSAAWDEEMENFAAWRKECDFKNGFSYKMEQGEGDFVWMERAGDEDVVRKLQALRDGKMGKIMDFLASHKGVSYPLEIDLFVVGIWGDMYRVQATMGNNTLSVYLMGHSDEGFGLSGKVDEKTNLSDLLLENKLGELNRIFASIFLVSDGVEGTEMIPFRYGKRKYQNNYGILGEPEIEEHFIYYSSLEIEDWFALLVFDTNYTIVGENRSSVNTFVLGQEECREYFCDILTQLSGF